MSAFKNAIKKIIEETSDQKENELSEGRMNFPSTITYKKHTFITNGKIITDDDGTPIIEASYMPPKGVPSRVWVDMHGNIYPDSSSEKSLPFFAGSRSVKGK